MNFQNMIIPSATWYVSNDVGMAGGSGTQQNPFGILTAIAQTGAGHVFYWRRNGVDLNPTSVIDFNRGGSQVGGGQVWWIGTDDNWVPLKYPNRGPTIVCNNALSQNVVASAQYINFLNIDISNMGSLEYGISQSVGRHLFFNCKFHNAATGLGLFPQARTVIAACEFDSLFAGVNAASHACVIAFCKFNQISTYSISGQRYGQTVVGNTFSAVGSAYMMAPTGGIVYPMAFLNNTVRTTTSDAFKWEPSGAAENMSMIIANNLFANVNGYNCFFTFPAGVMCQIHHNASYAAVSGLTNTLQSPIQSDWIVLENEPFEAAMPDMRLKRSAQARGVGTDFADCGALSRDFFKYPVGA